MSVVSKLRFCYGKLFGGGMWRVAYRPLQGGSKYEFIEEPNGTWIADPLLYEENGEHYLFVELFDIKHDKAGIGYYRFIDGIPVFQKKVMEQPFHMSYPYVFSWEGEHYMIPESAAGNTLDLYKATRFPDKWILDTNLIKGEKYVDTTIVQFDNTLHALGYKKSGKGWRLDHFSLDMNKKTLKKISEENFQENKGRPAGPILIDQMLRPAQDCSRLYGESIIWYQIDKMDGTGFHEYQVNKMTVGDISVEGNPDRVHTYSRDSIFEVVDLRFGKFDFLHGLKTFKRSINRET